MCFQSFAEEVKVGKCLEIIFQVPRRKTTRRTKSKVLNEKWVGRRSQRKRYQNYLCLFQVHTIEHFSKEATMHKHQIVTVARLVINAERNRKQNHLWTVDHCFPKGWFHSSHDLSMNIVATGASERTGIQNAQRLPHKLRVFQWGGVCITTKPYYKIIC